MRKTDSYKVMHTNLPHVQSPRHISMGGMPLNLRVLQNLSIVVILPV